MTSKEKVQQIHPNAIALSYTTNSGERYYLVWTKRFNGKRISEGKTASNAFVNAAKNLNL